MSIFAQFVGVLIGAALWRGGKYLAVKWLRAGSLPRHRTAKP